MKMCFLNVCPFLTVFLTLQGFVLLQHHVTMHSPKRAVGQNCPLNCGSRHVNRLLRFLQRLRAHSTSQPQMSSATNWKSKEPSCPSVEHHANAQGSLQIWRVGDREKGSIFKKNKTKGWASRCFSPCHDLLPVQNWLPCYEKNDSQCVQNAHLKSGPLVYITM